jgi:hypothetical protein
MQEEEVEVELLQPLLDQEAQEEEVLELWDHLEQQVHLIQEVEVEDLAVQLVEQQAVQESLLLEHQVQQI